MPDLDVYGLLSLDVAEFTQPFLEFFKKTWKYSVVGKNADPISLRLLGIHGEGGADHSENEEECHSYLQHLLPRYVGLTVALRNYSPVK